MTNSNNDIEELEELLTELEGQEAQIVTPYSEEDDAVTRLMDAPLGDQDWMVQVTALDRRMMSTSQLLSELQSGKVNGRTLVWRGGMDDWMPVSRIDELSRASAPPQYGAAQHNPAATQRNSGQRAAYQNQNLAPPPPAPQPRSQPLWSSPTGAPLPPPPSPMSPPFGMAPGAGLPPPPLALAPPPPPPVAMTPPPAPPSASYGLPKPLPVSAPVPDTGFSQGNTTRPVAVDFSDMMAENDAPLQSKRWVMVLSAVAILAVFVTVYSLSSGGGESAAKEPTAASAAARPQAVAALQPSSSATKEKNEPAPSPAAAPKAEAAATAAASSASSKARDEEEAEEPESRGASARQTAQARYMPRSESRRRSRNSGSEGSSRNEPEADEPAPTPAPAAAAPSTTARAEEEEDAPSEPAAVAEEVDEPPKSTGKSGNTFNREAAKAALDDAAAQAKNCRPQGGPSGTGRVQVRYEPSGKVANVAILTSKFDNTTAGSCVRMLFRRAKVPEFTGAPVVVVNKSFEIP